MRDVGGDFYFCCVLDDGRQRVLMGDVSGKGAAAAMSATLLLGAAAARDSDSPAVLLAQLNRVLHESRVGGFATCLCADFTAAGEVTLANAGHLPPYCNSREIELSSSLPLGIAAAAQYAETTLQLAPGETLTFLSDGVVEARNEGGELLGFERMAGLTVKRAEEIAEAAQNWGQEDDITVLTVRRLAEAAVA
jgi:serine phosphatase RsbU (regulator of sigma subunit)